MPVDYHAWTHRPKSEGGTDPIPGITDIPWIRRWLTSDETIQAGANDELIVWDDTENDYPDFFSTPSSTVITLEKNGLYEVVAELVWTSSKTEGSVVTLNANSTPGFFWNKGMYDEQNSGHTIEHTQLFHYSRRMEANTQLRLFVVHFAATDKSLEGGASADRTYIEVRYRGSWSGTAPAD